MDSYKKFAIAISIIAMLQLMAIIIWVAVKFHRRRNQLTETQQQSGLSQDPLAVIYGGMSVSTPPPSYQLCHTFTFPPTKTEKDFDHLPTYNEAISFENDYTIVPKS